MSGQEETIFDKIIKKEIPADVVWEDEKVNNLSFLLKKQYITTNHHNP